MFVLTQTRFKGLHLLYSLISLLIVRLPWWTLSSLLPSWRPRPSWSIKKCLYVHLARYVLSINSKGIKLGDTPNHLALRKDAEGLWIDPVPDLIVGEIKQWAEDANVKPVRIPGYWQHKKDENVAMGQKPNEAEKIAYFIHGGGFVSLSAHPKDPTANIPRGLLKYCTDIKRTFSIEYRLSTTSPLKADNAFPAALIDALAGYNYLINSVGYSPSQIVVVGDSAGANIALALTRYLIESAIPSVPIPSSLILLSPWCYIGPAYAKPGSSFVKCAHSDYILPPLDGPLSYGARALLGPLGASAATSNVYISPASLALKSGNFKGFPPSFIVGGDAEVFLDQIRVLKERMEDDMGMGSVTYHEAVDALHDFLVFTWHEPQRGETLRLIADWLSTL